MEQLKQFLEPLLDLLPPAARAYWYAIPLLAVLVVALVLATSIRRLYRALFGRRRASIELNLPPPEKLDEYPLPFEPVGTRRLTVEGVPVRLRLVVVAPLGKQTVIDETAIPELLDGVLWGLGTIARQDQPQVRVWPPQLSSQGFAAFFHRGFEKPEPEGHASRWVLVAGQTPARPRPVLLGLALWTDDPTLVGRLTLEARQWMDVLRIQTVEWQLGTEGFEPPTPSV